MQYEVRCIKFEKKYDKINLTGCKINLTTTLILSLMINVINLQCLLLTSDDPAADFMQHHTTIGN